MVNIIVVFQNRDSTNLTPNRRPPTVYEYSIEQAETFTGGKHQRLRTSRVPPVELSNELEWVASRQPETRGTCAKRPGTCNIVCISLGVLQSFLEYVVTTSHFSDYPPSFRRHLPLSRPDPFSAHCPTGLRGYGFEVPLGRLVRVQGPRDG